MNLRDYALSELSKTCFNNNTIGLNLEIHKTVMQILEIIDMGDFDDTSSRAITSTVSRLINKKPLTPLTGHDNEWTLIQTNPTLHVNNRCSSVYKNECNVSYDTSAIKGYTFIADRLGNKLHVFTRDELNIKNITFPYDVPDSPKMTLMDS